MIDVMQIAHLNMHYNDCKTGCLVTQRHNEVKDCLGDIAAQEWTQVVRERIIVKEADI